MKPELFHAWAAGFIDGEGCIQITRRVQRGNTVYAMAVVVSQKKRQPLELLHQAYGGSISAPDKKHSIYQWTISAQLANSLLKSIVPYMVVKRDEALLALEFQSRRSVRGSVVGERGTKARDKPQDELDFIRMKELRRVVADSSEKAYKNERKLKEALRNSSAP